MSLPTRHARIALVSLLTLGVAAGTAPAALAAPGDWTQLSQTSSAVAYPRVSNTSEPTSTWFGGALQVVWPQAQSPSAQTYLTTILDANGGVTTPVTQVLPDWTTVTSDPTLMAFGGQRFLSFSGLNPGRSGAQYFTTSPDGVTWNLSNGSMSQTQSAYASYGSDALDNAGTPVWVGNAGSTTGIRWHVGTSDANPAPTADQSYALSGCCSYSAAAARDEATGAVYAAFYSNSSATTENGINVGQILPASAGWRQAPGSTDLANGRAASVSTNQRVAMVSRPGGGVFVAYVVGYPTVKRIRVYDVVTGGTLDVPGSSGARYVGMSAEPDGRLWVTWNSGTKVKAVHTNPSVTRFGSVGTWGSPAGTEYLWKSSVAGTAGGASLVVNATTQNAINVWHTNVVRTLTIKAGPRSVRRGGNVRFTVTDAGDAVAGAKVKFGSRTRITNAAGKVTITAPGSRGRVKATASKDGYAPTRISIRVR
jgi:hypothetical protein